MDQKIIVTGRSVIHAAPDAVRIHLSVTGKEETYAAAAESIKTRTQALFESIRPVGIETGLLKTTGYSIQPNQEGYSDKDGIWRTRTNGFVYDHDLVLTLPREDTRLGTLMQTFAATGAGTVFHVEFILQDDAKIRDTLRAEAVLDAAHQADILSRAAGVKKGAILEIRHGTQQDLYTDSSLRLEKVAMGQDTAVQPNEVTMRDEVTVVFEITE